jgi:hypothetical protein
MCALLVLEYVYACVLIVCDSIHVGEGVRCRGAAASTRARVTCGEPQTPEVKDPGSGHLGPAQVLAGDTSVLPRPAEAKRRPCQGSRVLRSTSQECILVWGHFRGLLLQDSRVHQWGSLLAGPQCPLWMGLSRPSGKMRTGVILAVWPYFE